MRCSAADPPATAGRGSAARSRPWPGGDKGNRLNVSLFPYDPALYPLLAEQVTPERVHELFRHRGATGVKRYELPLLAAFNFVIDDVLEGGVNGSLNLDGHGKTNSFRLLSLTVRIPALFVRKAHSRGESR